MNFSPDMTFDPVTLGDDFCEVQRIYANFFAGLRDDEWDRPMKGGSKEWTLHETVAHLCALTGEGLESIQMRETAVFCRMFTKRPIVPIALLTGQLKLRGNLRLFPRFGSLFSVDARQ